ncbi:MAG: L,D-transpeptidase [Myxococcota bacterium]
MTAVLAVATWLLSCEDTSSPSSVQSSAAGERETAAVAEQEKRPEPEPEGPPKRIFAKKFVVNVRTEARAEAARIGYLRGGAVLRATSAEPVGHDGCRGGWFELTTGGYVCNGRDVTAFDGEELPDVRLAQPDRSRRLPYEYGFIRKDRTPVYRRLPGDEAVERYERTEERKPRNGSGADAGSEVAAADGGGASADATSGDSEASEDADGGGPPTLEGLRAEEDDADILKRWLMRGFYVSLDRTFDVKWRRYWRTQQSGFVPFQNVMLVEGSDFRGRSLEETDRTLPVAFVLSNRTARYVERDDGRLRRDRDKPGYHHGFRIVGEREQRGRRYHEGHEGYFYRADDVVRIEARDRPAEVKDTKWVDVDLGKQTLVAYEGDRPVYATLISSGRVRRQDVDELDHATPTGTFRFSSKHLTSTMDGDNAIDGPYSIDDVPYVMYFELAYATHTAFWHNRFGRPKSHGCINIAPLDSKWLFEWADPPLPEGWHGIYPDDDGPGTTLVIHGETPPG